MGVVNVILLQNAIFFAKNVLNDITESCEGDEYILKDFYVPRYDFSNKVKEYLYMYSTLNLPIHDFGTFNEYQEPLRRINGWDLPNYYLMYLTVKLHKELKQHIHQYKAIDDVYNTWICKPSYNARGFGIFCFNSMKDLFNGSTKKSPAPKIVQKYIEKSLLLKNLNP